MKDISIMGFPISIRTTMRHTFHLYTTKLVNDIWSLILHLIDKFTLSDGIEGNVTCRIAMQKLQTFHKHIC